MKKIKKFCFNGVLVLLIGTSAYTLVKKNNNTYDNYKFKITKNNEEGNQSYIVEYNNQEYTVVEITNDYLNLRNKKILLREKKLSSNSIDRKIIGQGTLLLATENTHMVDGKEFVEILYYDESTNEVVEGVVCTDYLRISCDSKTFYEKVIEFYEKYEGKQIDYDGNSGPQCVDFIKLYMSEIFDFEIGSVGHAVQYGNYTNFKNHNLDNSLDFISKESIDEIKLGDILVFNENYSSNHNYGHVAVATGKKIDGKYEVMEIGGNDPKIVRKNKNSLRNVCAVLRPKKEFINKYNNSNGDLEEKIESLINKMFKETERDTVEVDDTISQISEYVKKYSKIYHINYDVAMSKLYELTDNFTSDSFIENMRFSGLSCKGEEVCPQSYEEMVIYFMRMLSQNSERFNLNEIEIIGFENYESDENYGKIIHQACSVLNEDPCLVWAICMAESGFKSEVFEKYNNPSGLISNGTWWNFPTAEAGIVETVLEMKKYKLNGATTIEEIGKKYCPVGAQNDPKHLNDNWDNNVKLLYDKAKKDYIDIFGTEELKPEEHSKELILK